MSRHEDSRSLVGTSKAIVALRMYEAREGFQLMLFGTLVGGLTGLAGVLLNLTVHEMEHFRHGISGWWAVWLPAIGAILGLSLQRFVFRDSLSHGVPNVIESVTSGNGILPRGMCLSRLVSSALTVGSGGAAGLEGPIVVTGGAIGSYVARIFNMSQRRRVLLIACGTSGAIASMFNAPITGMIFSLEVILGEWKSRNLVPTITSAAVAAQVSRLLMGDKVPFPREEIVHTSADLAAFVLLGLVAAGAGWIMIKILAWSEKLFSRVPLPAPLVAGLGGLMVGLLALIVPQAQGEGYDSVRLYINGDFQGTLLAVALLIGLRLLATGCTLGSGGSGGVFAPSLFLGSAVGLIFGNLLHKIPLLTFTKPEAYALVGMASVIAGLMSAPLSGIFIILEICKSYDLILPLMLACLSATLAGRFLEEGSVYTRELISQGTFRRRGSGVQLLADVDISEVLSPCSEVEMHQTLGDFVSRYGTDQKDVYALVDKEGIYQGLIFLEDVRPYLFDQTLYPLITMASIADCRVPHLGAEATPDMAWITFGGTKRPALPVIDGHGRLVGVVRKDRLFDSTRTELSVHEES